MAVCGSVVFRALLPSPLCLFGNIFSSCYSLPSCVVSRARSFSLRHVAITQSSKSKKTFFYQALVSQLWGSWIIVDKHMLHQYVKPRMGPSLRGFFLLTCIQVSRPSVANMPRPSASSLPAPIGGMLVLFYEVLIVPFIILSIVGGCDIHNPESDLIPAKFVVLYL